MEILEKIIIKFDKLKVEETEEDIENEEIIKKCKKKKIKIEKSSLKYLIEKNITQSQCIMVGIALEKIIKEIIKNKSKLEDIKPIKIKLGEREKDHLFKNSEEKIIYYAELKSNLNLDTEKSKSTINKINDIRNELEKEHRDYKIKSYLVGLRYINKEIIPKYIKNKYVEEDLELIGINDYLLELGIKYKIENEEKYKEILKILTEEMF